MCSNAHCIDLTAMPATRYQQQFMTFQQSDQVSRQSDSCSNAINMTAPSTAKHQTIAVINSSQPITPES